MKMLQFVVWGWGRQYSLCLCKGSLAWLGCIPSVYWSTAQEGNLVQTTQVSSFLCSQTPHAPLQGQSGDTGPGSQWHGESWMGVFVWSHHQLTSCCFQYAALPFCLHCAPHAMLIKKSSLLVKCSELIKLVESIKLVIVFSHGREKLKVHLKAAGWQGVM